MTTPITHTLTPEAGRYDFDGACAPHATTYYTKWASDTFTLGIFQWVPKSSKKGVKRGKVFRRVKGYRGDEAAAYDSARQIINALNKESFPNDLSTHRLKQ